MENAALNSVVKVAQSLRGLRRLESPYGLGDSKSEEMRVRKSPKKCRAVIVVGQMASVAHGMVFPISIAPLSDVSTSDFLRIVRIVSKVKLCLRVSVSIM